MLMTSGAAGVMGALGAAVTGSGSLTMATALTGGSATAGAGVTGASSSGAGDGLRRETVALILAKKD
jgi:hypothetical protein